MQVFVTGASGWIGSAVVAELLSAGHQVTGLARSDASAATLESAGAAVLRGSLDDLDVLREGAAASDGVIHLAFNHEVAFSGDFPAAVAADRAAIEALGGALEGSDRPMAIATGLVGHPAGQVVTEASVPATGSTAGGRMDNERYLLGLAGSGVRSISVRLSPTVHGEGDNGFVAMLVGKARETGSAAYLGDGENTWPAVARADAAKLYRLAIESAPAGTVLHGVGEEGVAFREIAEAIGRGLDVPATSIAPEAAGEHFGWLGTFAGLDVRASSARTQELLGWTPSGPGLIEDLDAGHYFS